MIYSYYKDPGLIANVDLVEEKNQENGKGWTPLHTAATYGRTNFFKMNRNENDLQKIKYCLIVA